MLRLLGFLYVGFNIWMLIDAMRRRVETHWLWIIAMVPGGAVLYFFMVRSKDHDVQVLKRRLLSHFERAPAIEQLQHRFEESPSIVNRLALAQGLADAARYAEAKEHFAAVLRQRPEELDASFGLAVCELELGNPEAAVGPLQEIASEAPSYREFVVHPELAEVYFKLNRAEEGLELLRQLYRSYPRLEHAVLLASFLKRAEQAEEAASVLNRALKNNQDAPKHVRKKNRAWERQARSMLQTA